jgi:hypothetical protein
MTYISQAEYVAGTSPVYMVYCVSTLRTISRADVSSERSAATSRNPRSKSLPRLHPQNRNAQSLSLSEIPALTLLMVIPRMGVTHWPLQEIVWVVWTIQICQENPLLCKEGNGEVERPSANLPQMAARTMRWAHG